MAYEFWESVGDPFASIFYSETWEDTRLMKDYFLQKMDQLKEKSSPVHKKIKLLDDLASVEPMWLEEYGYRNRVTCTLAGTSTRTLTVTGKIFNTTASRTNLLKIANTGAILRYDAAGVTYMAKATAIDATNPILTVEAYGGTSLPTNGTDQEWRIINEPKAEADPASNPRFLDREFRYVTTERFDDTFQIEKTRAKIQMQGGISEVQHQLDALLDRMDSRFAYAIINQYPDVDESGNPKSMKKTATPTMCGLTWWPEFLFGSGKKWENESLLKSLGGEALRKANLDDLVIAMDNNGSDLDKGDWGIVTTPAIRDYMHDFDITYRQKTEGSTRAGFQVDEVILKRGAKPYKIIADHHWPAGTLAIVNWDKPGYGYFEDDRVTKGQLPVANLTTHRWQITAQLYGVILRDAPISIGMLKYIKEA